MVTEVSSQKGGLTCCLRVSPWLTLLQLYKAGRCDPKSTLVPDGIKLLLIGLFA